MLSFLALHRMVDLLSLLTHLRELSEPKRLLRL
jgi:hypothetical protein